MQSSSPPSPELSAAAAPQAPEPAPQRVQGPPYVPHAASPYRPIPAWEPPAEPHTPRTMPARPRELFAALALVVVADLALWSGKDLTVGGFGAAAFFLAVPAILLVAARARRLTLRLGAIVAMFVAIAARCAFAPGIGTVLLGLLGVFALAITMRNRSTFLTDVAASFGSTFVTIPQRLEAVVSGIRRHLLSTKDGQRSISHVLIPAVLVSTFVAIFALANPLVARWLGGVTRLLGVPTPVRVVTWLFMLFGAVLLVRPAIRRSAALEEADTTGTTTRGALIVARNALVPLNIVFFVYNALDATYLWAGAPPPGVSERQYAHEGAAWLTLALALLTVVVGVMFRGSLAHDTRGRMARMLAFGWLAQGIVLAGGTFRRLAIHITTSGLSNVRILGMFGTAVVAFGLVLVGVKLLKRHSFVWLLRRQLDALVVALLGFSLLPTHRISAPVNVSRVMAHEYQALVNIEEQASEAESAAALLPLLDHDDERIRRGVAALLLDERDALRKAATRRHGWRDRDFASARASRDLEAATEKLTTVLGDVDRKDAIQPFEYIRNSSIEGAIAQSEINKVEFAPTRSQKLAQRWVTAHTSNVGFEDLYDAIVVVDGLPRSRYDLTSAKQLFVARAGYDYKADAVGTITTAPLPGRAAESVEAKVTLARKSTRSDVVLVLEQRAGEWRIVEERGAGGTIF